MTWVCPFSSRVTEEAETAITLRYSTLSPAETARVFGSLLALLTDGSVTDMNALSPRMPTSLKYLAMEGFSGGTGNSSSDNVSPSLPVRIGGGGGGIEPGGGGGIISGFSPEDFSSEVILILLPENAGNCLNPIIGESGSDLPALTRAKGEACSLVMAGKADGDCALSASFEDDSSNESIFLASVSAGMNWFGMFLIVF